MQDHRLTWKRKPLGNKIKHLSVLRSRKQNSTIALELVSPSAFRSSRKDTFTTAHSSLYHWAAVLYSNAPTNKSGNDGFAKISEGNRLRVFAHADVMNLPPLHQGCGGVRVCVCVCVSNKTICPSGSPTVTQQHWSIGVM